MPDFKADPACCCTPTQCSDFAWDPTAPEYVPSWMSAVTGRTVPHATSPPIPVTMPVGAPWALPPVDGEKPWVVLVIWNLDPDYTVEELRRDLLEIDFDPAWVGRFKNAEVHEDQAAFLITFKYSEKYLANSLWIALDRTRGYLNVCGDGDGEVDKPIRVAKFDGDTSTWSSGDAPLGKSGDGFLGWPCRRDMDDMGQQVFQ